MDKKIDGVRDREREWERERGSGSGRERETAPEGSKSPDYHNSR